MVAHMRLINKIFNKSNDFTPGPSQPGQNFLEKTKFFHKSFEANKTIVNMDEKEDITSPKARFTLQSQTILYCFLHQLLNKINGQLSNQKVPITINITERKNCPLR